MAALEATSNRSRSEAQKARYACAAVNIDHVCEHCSRIFRPKRSERTKYCSRECAYALRREQARGPAPKPKPDRKCVTCQAPLTQERARKCEPCRAPTGYVAREKVSRPCEMCGAIVTGTAAKRVCRPCLVRKTRPIRKHRGRARHHGVAYEAIDPVKVFDRDGWRCQVCGVKTPKAKRGTFAPNAPELDHRIPMALGGGHLWSNVQCCCRACNGAKGATQVLGQINLFPAAL